MPEKDMPTPVPGLRGLSGCEARGQTPFISCASKGRRGIFRCSNFELATAALGMDHGRHARWVPGINWLSGCRADGAKNIVL